MLDWDAKKECIAHRTHVLKIILMALMALLRHCMTCRHSAEI